MNAILPDVSTTDNAPHLSPLDWVGMQGIDVPLTIAEADYRRELTARVDLQVDLPVPHIKGIHMSRLYRLLDDGLGRGEVLSPSSILKLLTGMIETHSDCGSKNARMGAGFDLLVRRPALVTEGLAGWRSYPVSLEARLIEGNFELSVGATIEYSSTCPCSAALSRQVVETRFLKAFEGQQTIETARAAEWLRDNATAATPHSQRSRAKVSVSVPGASERDLGLITLIDCVERAVATPVQSAVKRPDEQEFATLNGQNLMFVEDAARRIQAALEHYPAAQISVRHMESLHPHDAVAWSGKTHMQE